ncbi:hypothetical protein K7957_18120 [Sphingomonas yunnanensis]|uniref:hypothetical protein n=1 Tax=Sphingomonas yunnanensis TaxID=310400 RepID=UPI001CA6F4B6|nr:hypothetical protein [Sphingomonas yunnanensis]MBY9064858.1 hypothetical protein [Sphingomonas yunnanensis]
MTDDRHPTADPEHRRRAAFDKDEGTFGQGYSREDERKLGEQMPAGSVAPRGSRVGEEDPVLPPENGRRASFDPATGEVHGSGSGAGGGNPGEDLEDDRSGGDGLPVTGAGDGER